MLTRRLHSHFVHMRHLSHCDCINKILVIIIIHKKSGAKNVQNLGQFHTTTDFDREYLRNGTRYPKLERSVITSDSSRILRKKYGELWSTNYRVLHVSLGPPKLNFSAEYISALWGCWPLKF